MELEMPFPNRFAETIEYAAELRAEVVLSRASGVPYARCQMELDLDDDDSGDDDSDDDSYSPEEIKFKL